MAVVSWSRMSLFQPHFYFSFKYAPASLKNDTMQRIESRTTGNAAIIVTD